MQSKLYFKNKCKNHCPPAMNNPYHQQELQESKIKLKNVKKFCYNKKKN
jgi:hypothetical protein